jgi:hypothetical protein
VVLVSLAILDVSHAQMAQLVQLVSIAMSLQITTAVLKDAKVAMNASAFPVQLDTSLME